MPTPDSILRAAIIPALQLLPQGWDSREARVQLIAIALQESKLEDRWQVVDPKRPEKKGPARSFLQFELGTRASRGGVWGVYLHDASRQWLQALCAARGVAFEPRTIWRAIEQDDVLAFGLGRLLLRTDPRPLPPIGDQRGAWELYANRLWRPGKPHPETWPANYAAALAATV